MDTSELKTQQSFASLGTFISAEITGCLKNLEINRANLEEIKKGDKNLEGEYGGIGIVENLVGSGEQKLERLKEAQKRLNEGDGNQAKIILDERMEKLNELINRNLFLRAPKEFIDFLIGELNALRELKDAR